jgi:hypothetical protein
MILPSCVLFENLDDSFYFFPLFCGLLLQASSASEWMVDESGEKGEEENELFKRRRVLIVRLHHIIHTEAEEERFISERSLNKCEAAEKAGAEPQIVLFWLEVVDGRENIRDAWRICVSAIDELSLKVLMHNTFLSFEYSRTSATATDSFGLWARSSSICDDIEISDEIVGLFKLSKLTNVTKCMISDILEKYSVVYECF